MNNGMIVESNRFTTPNVSSHPELAWTFELEMDEDYTGELNLALQAHNLNLMGQNASIDVICRFYLHERDYDQRTIGSKWCYILKDCNTLSFWSIAFTKRTDKGRVYDTFDQTKTRVGVLHFINLDEAKLATFNEDVGTHAWLSPIGLY